MLTQQSLAGAATPYVALMNCKYTGLSKKSRPLVWAILPVDLKLYILYNNTMSTTVVLTYPNRKPSMWFWERQDWAKENCGSFTTHSVVKVGYDIQAHFHFDKASDATMFRLKWL